MPGLGASEKAELDLLRAVFDALPSHACVLDAAGNILAVNAAWRRFGVDNGSADANSSEASCMNEGGNYFGACGSASGPELDQATSFANGLRAVVAGERERWELEYPCHSPTERRWFVASATRIDGPGPARVLVSHEPVTDRRLALARERESQRLEALGALAGGIAHDFNNVLGSILGNAHLALAAAADDAARAASLAEHLRHIQRAGLHARDLVRRILAFSRRQAREITTQNLPALLDEGIELLRANQPAAVAMTLTLPNATLWVSADAGEIQQVLMNLCTNAWQALHGRGGRVDIVLDRVELDSAAAAALGDSVATGGYARLVVEDNGCGMDEATAARIFEPFFTTRGHQQGTGLGLAVVQGLVRRIGGSISFESTLGKGTRFEVLLPLSAPPSPTTDNASAPTENSQSRSEHAPAARVLLVDDDEVMGMTSAALLEAAGHCVRFQASALKALELLAEAPDRFDLLVSDHRMPEMSGLELCRSALLLRPELPCVLLSGWIADDTRTEALELGVRALVPKEDAFESLAPTVLRVLRQSPPQTANPHDSRFTPSSSQA
jgi:signal transduction histidine kinase/CheY-like chemotaxis protein